MTVLFPAKCNVYDCMHYRSVGLQGARKRRHESHSPVSVKFDLISVIPEFFQFYYFKHSVFSVSVKHLLHDWMQIFVSWSMQLAVDGLILELW